MLLCAWGRTAGNESDIVRSSTLGIDACIALVLALDFQSYIARFRGSDLHGDGREPVALCDRCQAPSASVVGKQTVQATPRIPPPPIANRRIVVVDAARACGWRWDVP
jgi:hypothetical protein